jgi:hypothetical protein
MTTTLTPINVLDGNQNPDTEVLPIVHVLLATGRPAGKMPLLGGGDLGPCGGGGCWEGVGVLGRQPTIDVVCVGNLLPPSGLFIGQRSEQEKAVGNRSEREKAAGNSAR